MSETPGAPNLVRLERATLKREKDELSERVLGQPAATDAFAQVLAHARIGYPDTGKPHEVKFFGRPLRCRKNRNSKNIC